ncbi:MAG: multidrug efflux SMR transporter [Pseudomonadota bacterium]
MHWLMLYAAIGLEVAGTTSLKLSNGLTRPGFFVLSLTLYGASFGLLGISLKALPVGVAYAIWAGAGTLLIAVIGIIWFQEGAGPLRLLFIGMIVAGAVGLNLTTRAS